MVGRNVPPDAFSVVMATGIVSIAARDHFYPYLDVPLLVSAALVFVVLTAGFGLRILAHPRLSYRLVNRPDIALRLFTFVAACAVLGARLVAHPAVVSTLAIAGTVAWLILAPLAALDVRSRPRSELRMQAHGAWLLISVATAGLAITAADLGQGSAWPGWLILAAAAWLLAAVLYVPIAALLARRSLAGLAPEQVTPDSWILMGAPAILALAGAHLRAALQSHPVATGWADAIGPVILVLWMLASLWIPVLLFAELWRIDHRPGSVRFTGSWWSAVFPLGMYSAGTQAVGLQLHLAALSTVSLVFFWNAFGLCILVAAGWTHSLVRSRTPETVLRRPV